MGGGAWGVEGVGGGMISKLCCGTLAAAKAFACGLMHAERSFVGFEERLLYKVACAMLCCSMSFWAYPPVTNQQLIER